MNTFRCLFAVLLILVASLSTTTKAQSPTPIIVQAANSAATATSTSSKPAASAADVESIPAAIRQLEQIKAANEEVLGKQKATLERLDELQQATEQLKIFANRG
jgi:hypothetical protein